MSDLLASLKDLRVCERSSLEKYVEYRFPRIGRKLEGHFLAYHSWRPGIVSLSRDEGIALLRARNPQSRAPSSAEAALSSALEKVERAGLLAPGELDMQSLVERMANFYAVQNPYEAWEFLSLARARSPKTVLEIGTAGGGMFNCLCQVAAEDALVISIDVGDIGGEQIGPSQVECEVFKSFAKPNQRLEFIRGSSQSFTVIESLARVLDGRALDLVLIDGDHNYGVAKADFDVYSRYATGGLVACHDICTFPASHGEGFEAGLMWNEVKARHRVREIIAPGGRRTYSREQSLRQWSTVEGFQTFIDKKIDSKNWIPILMRSDLVSPELLPSQMPHWMKVPRETFVAWGIGVAYC
jgi:predicted O-methyltransferase YrrM